MSYSVAEVVNTALKMVGVISPGESPTSDEMEDGRRALVGLYDLWASSGMFGRLDGVLSGGTIYSDDVLEWAAPEVDAPVELPVRVKGDDGEPAPPRDLSYIEVVTEATGERRAYVWDARQGKWARFDALASDDEAPLARRGVRGLAAVLAVDIAGDYGKAAPGPVVRTAAAYRMGLSARYGEKRRAGQVEYF